jgi:hypothetical protein
MGRVKPTAIAPQNMRVYPSIMLSYVFIRMSSQKKKKVYKIFYLHLGTAKSPIC